MGRPVRLVEIMLIAGLCAALRPGAAAWQTHSRACPLPPQLEITITAAAADNLPLTMQRAVDAVRAAVGASAVAAPADGISIEPVVAPHDAIRGYNAVNRLSLSPFVIRNTTAIVRAQAAAQRYGGTVALVDRDTHHSLAGAWQVQWLQHG